MRIVVFALALLPAAALAGEGASQRSRAYLASERCQNAGVQLAKRNPAPARLHPLNKEPSAEAYLGVLHLDNGCDKPIKVRDRR
jgi:hypothetical protein